VSPIRLSYIVTKCSVWRVVANHVEYLVEFHIQIGGHMCIDLLFISSYAQLWAWTYNVIRISPRWIHTIYVIGQVTSYHQLGLRVQFGFSRPPWTESATSPSYDIETRRSLMRWKANDYFCSCPRSKGLVDHPVRPRQDAASLVFSLNGLLSCQALSPCCGPPGRLQL
jgi:hypothetical protein